MEYFRRTIRFHQIFDEAPMGMVIVNADCRIVSVNKAFCQLLGYTAKELCGRIYRDIVCQSDNDVCAEMINGAQKRVNGEGELEKKFLHKNGEIVWALVKMNLVRNHTGEPLYLILQHLDITERKKLESEREITMSLLRIINRYKNPDQDLLDIALKETIKLTDSEIGHICFYDEEKKMFTQAIFSEEIEAKYHLSEHITTYPLEYAGYMGEVVQTGNALILNRQKAGNPYIVQTSYGQIELQSLLSVPVFVEGKIVAVVGVANKETEYDQSDLSHITILMDNVWGIIERHRYQEELIKSKEKTEESDRLKTAFLANISLAIRSPMNGIIGFSQLLTESGISDERRKIFSGVINSNCQQLLSMINDIIDLSKIETGQIEIHKQPVSLNEVLSDIYQLHKSAAARKLLDFYVNQQLSISDAYILTDKDRLCQVLNNVVDNAIKFTQHGRIELGCKSNASMIEFSVKDTGIGISPEYQRFIFERFRQGEMAVSSKYGGMGLGLSIAKEIIELLGGKIRVESEVGYGSSFYITLPYIKADINSGLHRERERSFSLKGYTILVVEDEISNYLLLKAILSPNEAIILHASSGMQALDIAKNYPEINLILMDIRLPDISGLEVTKEIKKVRSDIPVIALTAYSMSDEREEAINAGCNDFVSKPFTTTQLMSVIQNYLHK